MNQGTTLAFDISKLENNKTFYYKKISLTKVMTSMTSSDNINQGIAVVFGIFNPL